MNRKCETCEFWAKGKKYTGRREGECRKLPPVLTDTIEGDYSGYWPKTFEAEWCGEWSLRAPGVE